MLLDAEMRLIEPACAWLLYVALVRGRTRSPETWRTYGEALFDWWQTLEANGWLWDQVGEDELAAYRNAMIERGSQITGRPFARSTVNSRIRTVAFFYRWCESRGLVKHAPVPMDVGASRGKSFLAHGDARGGVGEVNSLTIREKRSLPRPAELDQVKCLLQSMGARDRLITEWAATTGMRRMELAGLKLAELPEPSAAATASLIRVDLSTTKGGMGRAVYPPLGIVDRTWAYIREERASAIRRARARGQIPDDRVFLTSTAKAMSPRRVGAVFYEHARRSGVPITLHRLRHLFAASMLSLLQREAQYRADIKPLIILQSILGHSSIETTMIYLEVVARDLVALDLRVEELFGEFL